MTQGNSGERPPLLTAHCGGRDAEPPPAPLFALPRSKKPPRSRQPAQSSPTVGSLRSRAEQRGASSVALSSRRRLGRAGPGGAAHARATLRIAALRGEGRSEVGRGSHPSEGTSARSRCHARDSPQSPRRRPARPPAPRPPAAGRSPAALPPLTGTAAAAGRALRARPCPARGARRRAAPAGPRPPAIPYSAAPLL